jgi:RNA polymerase sigma-70 factor, ECF subfamily
MSVINLGVPKTPLREVAGSTWRRGTARSPVEFDISTLRTTTEEDRRRLHSLPYSAAYAVRTRVDWDDRFTETVGLLQVRLHRLARRILHNDDLAEDAVQEAIFSLWKEGRMPPNPRAWLSRAVVNRSLHLSRSRQRRRRHEVLACQERPERDPSCDGARALEAKEMGTKIDDALSTLSDRLRMVFVLREIEQMDYESIADRLDVPLGTVRSRLARSREALQQALGRED